MNERFQLLGKLDRLKNNREKAINLFVSQLNNCSKFFYFQYHHWILDNSNSIHQMVWNACICQEDAFKKGFCDEEFDFVGHIIKCFRIHHGNRHDALNQYKYIYDNDNIYDIAINCWETILGVSEGDEESKKKLAKFIHKLGNNK